MISADSKNGRVFFRGRGIEFLRFSSCVCREAGDEVVRNETPGLISLPEECLPAIIDCLRNFGLECQKFSDLLEEFAAHESARKTALRILKSGDDSGLPPPWDSQLKDHQKIAVKAMTVKGLRGLCLFDEQGTGKTAMALAAFDVMREAGNADILFVVGPKSVLGEWEKDCRRFLGGKYEVSIIAGNQNEKIDALSKRADIFAIGYEALNKLQVRVRAKVGGKKTVLVVDEAFFVKNKYAERSKTVRDLRKKFVRVFVLSGTPAPNSPSDVVHQSDVADGGYAFRGYRETGDKLRDAEIVAEALETRGVYLRRNKESVAPFLPPKKLLIEKAIMSGRQERLYSDARDRLVVYLRSMNNEIFRRDLTGYFAKRAALSKLCACPSAVDELCSGDHAKLLVLDDLLRRLIEGENKKVVVWTVFTPSVEELRKRYEKYGLVRIDGSVDDKSRKEAIDRFQNDESARVFLGNPAAAGAGITLHAAADAVYVSYPTQAAHFFQSMDRIHRIGQTADSVRYHFLVCENTIETNQIRVLRQKYLTERGLFGETGDWPASIEDALAELEND